jgi:hypothetical protein
VKGETNEMKIPLSRGLFAIVDFDDFKTISRFKWCVQDTRGNKKFYAKRSIRFGGGHSRVEMMHRIILGVGPDKIVDHINGNGLDNRRINLRVCSISQNLMNTDKKRGCSSKYKGVYRHSPSAWTAYIGSKKNTIFLGCFKDEREAATAYDVVAKNKFGEFARLNNPYANK